MDFEAAGCSTHCHDCLFSLLPRFTLPPTHSFLCSGHLLCTPPPDSRWASAATTAGLRIKLKLLPAPRRPECPPPAGLAAFTHSGPTSSSFSRNLERHHLSSFKMLLAPHAPNNTPAPYCGPQRLAWSRPCLLQPHPVPLFHTQNWSPSLNILPDFALSFLSAWNILVLSPPG